MTAAQTMCKTIRDEVKAYCAELNLGDVHLITCLDTARVAHSAIAGKKCADRIKAKLEARAGRERVYP